MASSSLLLVLLAVLSCSLISSAQQAQAGFTFSGNLSSSDIKNNNWEYKTTTAVELNVPGVLIGGTFIASDVVGNRNSGNLDVISGSGYVSVGGVPFAYLAHFEANYSVNTLGGGGAAASVNGALNYIGHASLWLEERTPNNTVVAVRSLRWPILGGIVNDGFNYAITSTNTNPSNDIKSITFTGTSTSSSSFTVGVTFMASSHAGVAKGNGVDNIKLVPGSLESVFTVNNYPYQSSSNTLSLVMGVVTGTATISTSGQTLFSPNNGGSSMYFSLSKSAYVSGKQASVTISSFESGNFSSIGNDDVYSQVTGRYGASASVKLVRVTFPAGASNIAYDPSIGAGVPAQDASAHGSASTAVASLVLIVVAMFAAMM